MIQLLSSKKNHQLKKEKEKFKQTQTQTKVFVKMAEYLNVCA